ncbi:hypothetical protein [Streptomyces nondiastaticus]|uniref:CsbD family protein n=1 Tax=Streptomyces nondiastaticus TaxID=3154512 RepID=A0ABW6U1T5_9ACTN
MGIKDEMQGKAQQAKEKLEQAKQQAQQKGRQAQDKAGEREQQGQQEGRQQSFDDLRDELDDRT